MDVRVLRRRLNRLEVSAVGREGDVVLDRVAEEEVVLRDIRGVFPDRLYRQ